MVCNISPTFRIRGKESHGSHSLVGGQWDKGWLMISEGFPLVPKSHRDAFAEITGKQVQELQKVLDEFLEC
jgi:hypothetical protein